MTPGGFARLSVEHFRAYLYEMVGLGVLPPNNGAGWHLRSPNVLRMIEQPDDVVAELVSAASASVPKSLIALETRRPMSSSGHRSEPTGGCRQMTCWAMTQNAGPARPRQ